eukprot:gene8613-560_t
MKLQRVNNSVEDLKKHKKLFLKFKQQCTEEMCVENLYFLEKETHFRSKKNNQKHLQEEAIEIFSAFLEEDAPYEINVSSLKLKPVKNIILNEPQEISAELFHDIAFEVEWMLSDNLQRFHNKMNVSKEGTFNIKRIFGHHESPLECKTPDCCLTTTEESLNVYKKILNDQTEDYWKEYEDQYFKHEEVSK